MEKTKTVAPQFISRLNLYNTLTHQYGGINPFVLQKDGKEVYSFKEDRIAFTCCNQGDHKHYMSPLQMLQLIYIYGHNNPCPICNKIGLVNRKRGISGLSGQESGSDMEQKKKYLATDDPVENAKRESILEAETNSGYGHVKEDSYHTKKEDEIAESVSYEDYIKENPEFENTINANTNVETPQVEEDEIIEAEYEDDDIVESVSYDEYIVKNPDFNSKIIGDERFNRKPVNRYDDEYLYQRGHEEGSIFAHNDDQERSVQNSNDHVKEEHSGHGKIIKTELPSEMNDLDDSDMNEVPDNSYDDFYDDVIEEEQEIVPPSTVENEKSNDEDTNILSNESKVFELNSSNDLDDDEEDIEIQEYK